MYNDISQFNNAYRFIYLLKRLKIETQLFIDSKDILEIVLGIKSITRNNSFDEKEFTSDKILIHSLIFDNWLKNINVLLPHEDEVLYNVKRFLNIINSVEDVNKEEVIHYLQNFLGINIEQLIELKPKDILLKLKKDGKQLYITRYLLNNLHWQTRLKYLWGNRIIANDEISYDYHKFTDTELFNRLLNQGFAIIRPKCIDSNIVDALVLCILNDKLVKFKNNYNSGLSNIKLPIFYDSSKLFISVLEKSGLENQFTFPLSEIKETCIIQEHSFFLLKALFSQEYKSPLISAKNYSDYNEYKELTNKVNIEFSKCKSFDAENIEKIKEFIDTKFIRVFWINKDKEADKFFSNLKIQLNTREVRSELNDQIQLIIYDIKNRVEYYSTFRNIFSTLIKSHQIIKDRFTENLKRQIKSGINIYRDYGLTRFSIFSKDCEELQAIIFDLFSEDENINLLLSHQLTNAGIYLTNGYIGDDDETHRKLIIGIAVLWILEKYDLIIEILNKFFNKYKYYSLAFFHAAALVKHENDPRKTEKVIEILDFINCSHGVNYNFNNNYKTAIAASYIYYILWEKNSKANFRTDLQAPHSLNKNKNTDVYLLNAIKYARNAIKYLSFNDRYKEINYRRMKYYYIINNYIYYVTIGCPNSQFNKLDKYVKILENVNVGNPEYWQYRYDDTLSLYYLRETLLKRETNIKLSSTYLKRSLQYNINAERKVLTYEDLKIIRTTREKIDETCANIFNITTADLQNQKDIE